MEAGRAQLRGRWLAIARAAWIASTAFIVLLFVASLAPMYRLLHVICPANTACEDMQLTLDRLQALEGLGLSLDFYAAYMLVLNLVFVAVYLTLALVIFLRKSDDWLALFSAFMLVTFGAGTFSGTLDLLAAQDPGWWLPIQLVLYSGDLAMITFFFVFPTGGFVGSGLLAQVYRYRRVSQPVERQQTKWVVFGVTVGLASFLGVLSLVALVPSLEQNPFVWLFVTSLIYLLILLIPLSIGMAILRSRLWDIDILINRSLVYGGLTGTLGLVYFGSVVLLQQLFHTVTGEQSDLAIVASTLGIAALFNPLRRRIQSAIDRRFYRRKYDAAKTLAAFSATVHDEVDLQRLSDHLVAVVEETMQPAHVSLWLRKGDKKR